MGPRLQHDSTPSTLTRVQGKRGEDRGREGYPPRLSIGPSGDRVTQAPTVILFNLTPRAGQKLLSQMRDKLGRPRWHQHMAAGPGLGTIGLPFP